MWWNIFGVSVLIAVLGGATFLVINTNELRDQRHNTCIEADGVPIYVHQGRFVGCFSPDAFVVTS